MRQLGLGYANLGALLMARGLAYDSDEGRAYAAAITALMTGRAYRQSAEIAARMGPFDEFEQNRGPMLGVMEKHRAAVPTSSTATRSPTTSSTAPGTRGTTRSPSAASTATATRRRP